MSQKHIAARGSLFSDSLLASTEQAITDSLKGKAVAGDDETGVAISLWWMYVLRTEEWTLYHLDPSKDDSAIETMGVLLVFAGILVHDHYKVYFRYAAFHPSSRGVQPSCGSSSVVAEAGLAS